MESSNSRSEINFKSEFDLSKQQYPQELLLFQILDVALKITGILRHVTGSFGITPSELRILAICLEEGECTAADIASRSIFENAGISRMVDRLVQRKLLVRGRTPKDRRVTILKPTELAYEFALRLCPTVERFQEDSVASLTAEDIDSMKSWLDAMSDDLDQLDMRNYV